MSPDQAQIQNRNRCLLGGTFDRLHLGHEELIIGCLRRCNFLEIWLTSDEMIADKSGKIESFEIRKSAIEVLFQKNYSSDRLSIHRLIDKMGPAPQRDDCDAIGCTSETREACEQINRLRLENGLVELEIIEVPHKLNQDGMVISSSSIRAGIMDRSGNLWLTTENLAADHIMPRNLDSEMKTPAGQLFTGPESEPSIAMEKVLSEFPHNTHRLIAVGDVTVNTLLDMNIVPDIGVVDGRTKRLDLPEDKKVDKKLFSRVLTCTNEPGMITSEFKKTLKEASALLDGTLVVVDGEEDLAPMILHLCLEIGYVVLYGQPKEGIVVKVTDENTKINCKRLLSLFTTV